jgi:hypothetical protein
VCVDTVDSPRAKHRATDKQACIPVAACYQYKETPGDTGGDVSFTW